MQLDFTVQHAAVVGGAGGLGRAIAAQLARSGAQVVATGVQEEELALCRQTLPDVRAERLDVTDDADVRRFFGQFARLDILVNAAGTIVREQREFELPTFARVLDVNLTGLMRACTAARPLLARTQGKIVNLASMLSFFGSGQAPAYSASKGGVAQLTKSLAIAWAPEQIRVNAVAPGWIATPLTQPLVDDAERSQAILRRTPLGRWGQPDDVAGAVAFLCSDAARFVTGALLAVDGGYSIA